MARVITKNSVFGKGDSYKFRLAIRGGLIEHVSRFIAERYATINLGGLLHYALSYNQIEVVRLLIMNFKCSVDCRNELGETPLHLACRIGDHDVVRMLVSEYGADLLAHDKDNDTPLNIAVLSGHDQVVSYLTEELKLGDLCQAYGLARMVSKTSIFGEGDCYSFCFAVRMGQVEPVSKFIEERYATVNLGGLLHYAFSYYQFEIVRLLITKFKCSVDCRNELGETPLHLACRKGDPDVVRMLVSEYKADLLAHDNSDNTPLSRAVTSEHNSVVSCLVDCSPNVILRQACDLRNEELAKWLLSNYHIDPLAVDDNGDTILHTVASNGSVEILNLITKYKCPIDSTNNDNQTPLHYACQKGNVAAVRVLISQHKANVNFRDSQDNTPLAFAASNGHTEVVKCLIDEFNCSHILNQDITILQVACFEGHIDLAETLIADYELDQVSVDDNENTILHYAAMFCDQEMLSLLITKYKCPVDSRNCSYETPLHCACQKGNIEAVRILISKHNADLNAHCMGKSTPLNEAALNGHTNVVKCLFDEFGCKDDQNRTVLHSACREGHTDLVETLLSQYYDSLDLLSIDDDGETPIHHAAHYGQQEVVNLLITKYKCPVDCRNGDNQTLLHKACIKGHYDLVKMLISEHKADINARDDLSERTSLHLAVLFGQTEIVKYLIDEYKCTADIKGSGGTEILHEACRFGYVKLVELMLEYYKLNLDPLSFDEDGNTPLHTAAMFCDQEMLSLLITKYKCPVDSRNCSYETPLHCACQKGNIEAVRILISKHNADLNAHCMGKSTPLNEAALNGHTNVVKCLFDEFGCKDDQNRTVLHSACREGHTDLVETLLSQYYDSLDLLSIDDDGETPIHHAAHYGQQEVVNLLITKYKCPVDCRNGDNQTLLHKACIKGHYDLVKMLISEHKADINARDDLSERTSLHLAVLFGQTEIVKYLIDEYKCTADIKGSGGTEILHEACRFGYVKLVELMLEYYKLNLDPLSFDEDGNTPLHTAASNGQKKVASLLLSKYNCPVDCRNNINETPLHCACHRGDLDTVKMLISEYKADLYAKDEHENTPTMAAALEGETEIVKSLIFEFGYDPNIKGHHGRTILHLVCSDVEYGSLAEKLIANYDLDPMAVDDNGNTPLHLATLKGNEEMVNILITKYKCPIDCKNRNSESPLDLALANGYQNIISLMKNNLFPMIPREGYICAAQTSICIIQVPSDRSISVIVDSVDDETLHPKLEAKEFLLTPVVQISSDTNVFSPDRQAVIELLKTTELHDSENNPIPMFSNTHSSQPPRWRDLNPDDFEVLQDRIVFNTTQFCLFTVIARLPTPTNSITVTQSKDQEPVELTLSEVSNVKVVIPPSSIKSESAEMKVKITANFDHPSLCDESVDATACITLEPHGLEFKERIPIRIPIPDYAQITEMYSNAKLQFVRSSDSLDSECATWMIIPEDERDIVKEDNEYIGIVYFMHLSNQKARWLNIPKIKREIQGPIHEFRKSIAKRSELYIGRCQVFMSSEIVIENYLNFSIAALLHPLQEFHEIPKNYDYMLYDSEKTQIKVRRPNLKLIVELEDFCNSKEPKRFCEEVQLSGDFSARADFNIILDSTTCFVDGAVLGKLLIEHGEAKAHKMNLIKVILYTDCS